jgi:hypothetical protein
MALRPKKMAALAEPIIYQAQGIELEAEKQAIKEEISSAAESVQTGKAFDEYAAKVVKMHERNVTARVSTGSRPVTVNSDDEKERKGNWAGNTSTHIQSSNLRPLPAS